MKVPNNLNIFKEYDKIQIVILMYFSIISLLSDYSTISFSIDYPLIRKFLILLIFWFVILFYSKFPFKLFNVISSGFYAMTLAIVLLTIFSSAFFTESISKDVLFFQIDVVPFAVSMMVLYIPKKILMVIEKQGTFLYFLKHVGIPLLIICLLLMFIDFGYAFSLLLVFFIIFLIFYRFTYLIKFISILIILLVGLFAITYLNDSSRTIIVRERIETFIHNNDVSNDPVNKSHLTIINEKIKEGGFVGVGPNVKNEPYKYQTAYLDILYHYGLIGGIFVLSLYILFIFQSIKNIFKSSNLYILILQLSILVYFSTFAFVHILISIGILPFIYIHLPFIFTGGTTFLIDGMLIAILLKRNFKDQYL